MEGLRVSLDARWTFDVFHGDVSLVVRFFGKRGILYLGPYRNMSMDTQGKRLEGIASEFSEKFLLWVSIKRSLAIEILLINREISPIL